MTAALFVLAMVIGALALWGSIELVRARLWEMAPLILAGVAVSATAFALGIATLS